MNFEQIKSEFIRAIKAKKKVLLTFYAKKYNNALITRTCAPMDLSPISKGQLKNERFSLWDFDSPQGAHTVRLDFEKIVKLVVLDEAEKFNPAEFITWSTKESPWFVKRDWGDLS